MSLARFVLLIVVTSLVGACTVNPDPIPLVGNDATRLPDVSDIAKADKGPFMADGFGGADGEYPTADAFVGDLLQPLDGLAGDALSEVGPHDSGPLDAPVDGGPADAPQE